MASSADSRQTTPTKIPLPKHGGSKVVNRKSCDTNSSAKSTGKFTKEIGPRKVSSTAIREVGTKQSPSAVSNKVQASVTKELRETKSSVTKNIKKDQPIISKEIKKERQQTTVSKDIRKEYTSVSKEVIKEKNQTINSRDVKKEQTIVSKEVKKDQLTSVSNDIKKQNSAVSVSDIQPAKSTLKDQADDVTEYSSSVLRREQTVIYVGPPIKTDNISVNKLSLVTDTNQKTCTTDIKEDSNCSHQNEEHQTPSKIEIYCQNETPRLTSLNFRNEEDSVVMENVKNELSPDSKEIADFVDVVHITKHTCHSRKESRKGKISDSSDSGVSLGGADVAQIDDFYDDIIGVQAKKEVQEFSEVLNTCDDENDTSLISGVNSNVVETSLATVTNLKEGISDYDCDENHGERGSKFLGLHNYVPSNLKIYTDWANHYLEKARNKRFISDLQQDVSDGVLLADVIEAVTNEKIREIKSKPKNTAQMVENINTCLTFLTNLGVSVEGLSAKDIKDGNLKAILGLFFSLSRYKQQQKTQHKQEQSKTHSGETTHQGSSKNQLNGGEMQSRLPSPFKSGNSRCPTITNPSTKPVSSTGGKSKSSTDKHLNQQNNNTQSATLPSGSSLNPAKTSHPSSRATSPAVPGSGIPTPGGRSLTTPRPSGEKQPRVVSTGSTTSTSSTASNKSTSQKTVPPNKNSMLDKFKFFNSKDKSKGKGGVPKSTSKTSTGSTASTSSSSLALSSDRDSRTSCDTRSSTASARSSSSTDPGALSFSPETESPKLPPKTKSLGKPAASKKEHPSTLPLTHSDKHHNSSASHHGTSSALKKSSSKTDLKSGQKGSKIGTLIPKTASKSSKSASSTPTSTGIPTPTSIPKPSSSKSRSKDEKSKSHSQSSSAATSPSVSGIPSSKLSHQSGFSAYGSSSGSHGKQHYESISDQSKTSSHDQDKMLHTKGRYTEIDYSEGKIERVGDGQYSKNNLKMAAQQSAGSKMSNKEGNSPQTVNIVKPTCSVANTQMHAMSGMADLNNQSGIINRALPPPLPKTEPPPRSNTPMKEHSNNNAAPSQKDGAKNDSPSSPPGQGSISGHKSDSTSSSSSHSGPSGNNSNSSTESVIYRPSDSGSDVGSISATNSPRLGLKVLQPQQPINKSANNVAIVQPRHGEKVETTFDSEVRTKTVNKQNDKSSKETTFSEKETTFVDDSGEAMDIKPMQPILRSMPYGTGYLRGYSNPGGKIFHNPGYATPTAAYFASTSRLGMNRPLMDHGKFYSGPIRKTPSSGLNSSFDGDYSSDYESFDYISGYMSDGDILKGNNKVEDMNCGYMSEGGASLYARRLQQRFREGMQAVKECMQKNTAMIDDDSFDDSSSISSGEISDAVNEISTDDGNLTGGSSQSDHTNPYSSLKRAPQKDVRQGPGQFPVKRTPNLGTSAFMGSDYGSESGPISGWRKYSLPQTNRLLSSDPADYAYLYNNYEHLHSWRTNQANQMRKLSNVSQPEIHHYRRHSDDYANSETSNKRDSETNTDQSHLLESSMRRMQQGRPGSGGSLGQGIYGYRRPTSNTSTSSAGSGKGEEVTKSSTIGCRLAKHAIDANGNRSSDNGQGIPRPGSAQALRCTTPVTDSYGSSTLERRKKGSVSSLKTSNSVQTDSEIYKSNTLGRTKKAFGNGMGKGPSQGENGNMCSSTIISNPHATYGKNFSGGNGNYVAMEYGSPRNSNHGIWLKSANGNANSPMGHVPTHLSETESMDSISSHASSIQAQIQQARALSGASARILSRDSLPGNGMGLSRSNSVKSTHSDSAYACAQYMSDHEMPHTNSFSQIPSPQPPSSPTPSNSSSSRFTYPMTAYGSPSAFASPGMSQNMVRSNTQTSLPPYGSLALSKINRDEDGSRLTKSATLDYSYSDYDYASVHGSNLSLVSSVSSHYSTAEEKQNAEIRKLRRELEAAQEKVSTLTTQLSTNKKAHVVAAFEQSLSNMTHRLQHLTSTANQKDSELTELRTTIEALKRQSGLNIPDPTIISPNVGRRHTSPGMVAKVDIHSSPNHQTHQHNQHHHHHHHTQGGRAFHTLPMPAEARITRQMSSDSVSSINSLSSACSMTSQQSAATDGDAGKGKKKKKGWLRSSFSKAFAKKKNRNGSMSDCEMDIGSLRSNASAPNSPLMQVHMTNGPSFIKGSHSSGAIYEAEDVSTVLDLRKQLRDKDMKLTDTRLEALSSAHQLEQLRETMTKMKNEMSALKADNDRLHRMMTSRGLNSSQSSLHIVHSRTNSDSLDRSLSITEQPSLEMLLSESQDREGKRVTMTVYLGSKPNPLRMTIEKPAEVLIGSLSVSGKTKWDILDNIVRKILKEYVLRVDPVTNLGLSAESVFSYHIGEIMRTKDAELPELLPIGYLVGETMQIGICLKGTKQNSVDSLAFETLIPKSIVQRYVSLLLEHRRIILCGPSGTGKTYLAQKLAEHLVLRSGKELTAGSVATFNVDHKTAKELRQYLANIADQCENSGAGELPSVIILDNLHHVGSLGEVFNGFLSVKYQKCPYIIGTMNQATCSTTNLQLHHNFRWVLCANHMEPVKGFLGRFLRRKLVEAEVRTGIRNNDLNKIIDWIPKVWLHINKFLETHSSSDVTIGPRLFLTCPMDITASQIWFIDLWNYSIIPYMLEAVREGLQVYGRRAPWEDPTDWIMETYPWAVSKEEDTQLLRIRQEDVGYDTPGIITSTPQPKKKSAESATENGDQLLNMIKRLQEAANYSSQSQDDDSASIDSHNSSIQEISISSIDSAS